MTITTYQVQGMTCGHCVSAVKTAVGSVPGVQAVEIELASGIVTVTGAASESAVAQAISKKGYDVIAPASEPVGGGDLRLVDRTGGCCCG